MWIGSAALLTAGALAASACWAEEKPEPSTETAKPSVFDLPGLQAGRVMAGQAVGALMAKGDYAAAEKVLRQVVEKLPHDFHSLYNLACALARQGKKDEALAALEKAVDLGFRDANHVQADEDLAALRGDERFKAAVKKAAEPMTAPPAGWQYQIEPAEIVDGQAPVSEKNTAWDPRLGVFRVFFQLDGKATEGKPVCAGYGKAGGHVWGYDAFAKIQDAVNAVAQDGTVNVMDGTYAEVVSATKRVRGRL